MPIRYEGHGGPVMGLDTSIQKNLIASASLITLFYYGNLMKLEIQTTGGHDAAVNVAKFSKSGKLLATGGDDAQILIWDIENLKTNNFSPIVLSSHTAKIVDIDFSKRVEKKLPNAGWDHTIKIWDIETGQLKKSIIGHEGPVDRT